MCSLWNSSVSLRNVHNVFIRSCLCSQALVVIVLYRRRVQVSSSYPATYHILKIWFTSLPLKICTTTFHKCYSWLSSIACQCYQKFLIFIQKTAQLPEYNQKSIPSHRDNLIDSLTLITLYIYLADIRNIIAASIEESGSWQGLQW